MQLFIPPHSLYPPGLLPPTPHKAATWWKTVLRPMYQLHELILASTDTREPLEERLLQYLDHLFADLVMPSVTRPYLKDWITAAPVLAVRVWEVFPNLEHLVLEAIIMTGNSADAWYAGVSALPESKTRSSRMVRIDVESPRYSFIQDGRKPTKVAALDEVDALPLRQTKRRHPGRARNWQYSRNEQSCKF